MSALVVRKPADWTLDSLRERLVPPLARAGVVRAIAFGSYARGTADGFSDLDLVVVLETERPRFERASLLDEVFRAVPIGIDLLVFTPAEFEAGCRDGAGIFDAIVREGVTLYERSRDTA